MNPSNNFCRSPNNNNIQLDTSNKSKFDLLSYNPKKQKYFSKKKYFKQLIKSPSQNIDNHIFDYSLLATRKKRALENLLNNHSKTSLTKTRKINYSEKNPIKLYIKLYDENNNIHKFPLYVGKNIGFSCFIKNVDDFLQDIEKDRKSVTKISLDDIEKGIKLIDIHGLKILSNYKYIKI